MYCIIPLVLGFVAGRSCGCNNYGNFGCGCGCNSRRRCVRSERCFVSECCSRRY